MSRIRFALIAPLLLSLPIAAHAQRQFTLKRDVPATAWTGCPKDDGARKTVTAAQQQEAERYASAATQASLLGDRNAALDQLTRAAAADPTSKAIVYRLGRALDEADRAKDALPVYCLYLALAPEAPDAQEVRDRARAIGTPAGFAVPAEARQAFIDGIAQFDAGKVAEAETSFGQASAAVPNWSAPVFNRALARMALLHRADATEDFRHYLELSPGAADFNDVLNLIASFQAPAAPQVQPGSVFLRGVFVPGLGQFTTGRTGAGMLYLGAAAGAVGVGLGVKRSTVQCLSEPVNGVCPAGQIDRTNKDRPYLVPGIAGAFAIGIIGAIDAARSVSKRNAKAAEGSRTGSNESQSRAPHLELPAVNVGLDGARIDLVRLRF